jgi:dTDP-4-dehydrorhamnose reductase
VATERKSAYELARRRNPDIEPASKASAPLDLPDDVSLDTSRWQALRRRFSGHSDSPTPVQ